MNDERFDDDRLDHETSELLASEEPGAPFPRDEIRDRIRASVERRRNPGVAAESRVPWLKIGGAIAASLMIFVAGAEYGRRVAAPIETAPVATVTAAPEPAIAASLPLSIQTHGSQYVAEMARMAETFEELSPDEREQAREVAIAVLFGAAAELLRAVPEDDSAASVARVLLAQKQIANADGSLRIY